MELLFDTVRRGVDFRTAPERWYEEPPGTHAFGDEYQTPGYVTRRMHDKYEWTIGLGSDEPRAERRMDVTAAVRNLAHRIHHLGVGRLLEDVAARAR